MKTLRWYLQPIYWVYIYLPILIGLGVGTVLMWKVRAEIRMCRTYYSEMETWDCYWAPKVLPQRSGGR
jgi:hypothetical protein